MTRRLAAGLLALALPAAADQVVLTNGDRVTGQVVAKGTQRLRIQTPYGLLVIPLDKIGRIRKDDGSEEVLNAPTAVPTPAPTPAPAPRPPLRLELVVSGHSFWQAWDPKSAPADPSLRFEVQLDGIIIGAYRDPLLDPQDLPKATVNTFAFLPDAAARQGAPGMTVLPPETKEGGTHLAFELPPEEAGTHKLRVVYQANEGPFDEPRWTDLAEAAFDLEVRPGPPTTVRLEQSRGTMQFMRKHMQGVETFLLRLDTPPPEP